MAEFRSSDGYVAFSSSISGKNQKKKPKKTRKIPEKYPKNTEKTRKNPKKPILGSS